MAAVFVAPARSAGAARARASGIYRLLLLYVLVLDRPGPSTSAGRLPNESLEHYYNRVLSHTLGYTTAWGQGHAPPECEGRPACQTSDFWRLPGTPPSQRGQLRVVAVLEK
eukprot:scaffold43077_cov43-Prasinocladus_malaysianus.AAC.2